MSQYFNILVNDFVFAKDSGLISVRVSYKNESTENRLAYLNLMHIIYNDSTNTLKSSELFLKAFNERLKDRKLTLDDIHFVHFHIQ